jgi:hypothetical protein
MARGVLPSPPMEASPPPQEASPIPNPSNLQLGDGGLFARIYRTVPDQTRPDQVKVKVKEQTGTRSSHLGVWSERGAGAGGHAPYIGITRGEAAAEANGRRAQTRVVSTDLMLCRCLKYQPMISC